MRARTIECPPMAPRGGKRPGAGRPKKFEGERVIPVGVSLPESLLQEARDRAARQGVTVSDVVASALRRAFRKRNPTGGTSP